MIRFTLATVAVFVTFVCSWADPVKKVPVVDLDKLSKVCVETFFKSVLDGKVDEAFKMCATPFREPDGMKCENLDQLKLKREFERPPPAGVEVNVTEVLSLDKFNEWAKKKEMKELDEDQIKEYGEYLGKDGRIVVLEIGMMGAKQPKERQRHMHSTDLWTR